MAIKRIGKKTVKRKSVKLSRKKFQRGTIGNFFVFGILALLMILGITAVGGLPSQTAPTAGQEVMVITPTPGTTYSNLQLKTFGYVTVAPTPTIPANSLCANRSVNTEPIILVGYSPAAGQTVGATGQIKVWVNDEHAPFVAPGEGVDPNTGATTPGDRAAKAQDGLLDEPALYIAPASAESGGAAHFPDFIKGWVNNNPQQGGFGRNGNGGTIVKGPQFDPLPPGSAPLGGPNPNGTLPNNFVAEYIWNVSNLGLTTGTYQAEFVVHDGDFDRGIGCVSIQIQ
jgi:hypothetical protein